MGSRALPSPASCRQPSLSAEPVGHWQHLNVLVVEDHSTYRVLMGWFLQKLGLGHQLVSDGCLAIAAIRERPFDLIITDCQMPSLDGYGMTRAIRLLEHANGQRRVPVIALTANLVHDDPQRCRDAGMDAWLLKPLALEQLREVLLHWLPGSCGVAPLPLPAVWPSRDGLIKTFGSTEVVNHILSSLLAEAWEDNAIVDHARQTLNAPLLAERLHRLVGSLAFLGATDLESTGSRLIEQLQAQGVVSSQSQLDMFLRDLRRYLAYLADL